ncbi:hypothetical protein Tco_1428135 [Tanacetum coccineum]
MAKFQDGEEIVASVDDHTGELAKSTALGAVATGTGEIDIVGGLKYSWTWVGTNYPNHLFLVDTRFLRIWVLNNESKWMWKESIIEAQARIQQKLPLSAFVSILLPKSLLSLADNRVNQRHEE